jgi:glucokinase
LPGDNNVRIIMEEFVENLSLFLQGFFDTEQPEVVIIGGNIAKAHHFFLDELKIRMRSKLENCSLKIAALGEDAALMGASRMFIFDSMEK